MKQKSYNKNALRGLPDDDRQWQADMAKGGIFIPDELLYTPEGPRNAMKQIREKNVADMTKAGMSEADAHKNAKKMYQSAIMNYDNLLKQTR